MNFDERQVASAHFRKSTHSTGNDDCVEGATINTFVVVRDTKDRNYGHVTASFEAWAGFTAAIRK